jgi:hypothetical protein
MTEKKTEKKADKNSEKKFAFTLIGMKKDEAEVEAQKEGFNIRVVEQDGQNFAGTCDYRFDRINLYITDGIIKKVAIG